MNKETFEALKKSIEKWEKIVAEKGKDLGSDNCALCGLFATKDRKCVGCPVYMKTGEPLCRETPYIDWLKHHAYRHFNVLLGDCNIMFTPCVVECPTCKELAQEELEFLKSLLPETQKTKKKEKRENGKEI